MAYKRKLPKVMYEPIKLRDITRPDMQLDHILYRGQDLDDVIERLGGRKFLRYGCDAIRWVLPVSITGVIYAQDDYFTELYVTTSNNPLRLDADYYPVIGIENR